MTTILALLRTMAVGFSCWLIGLIVYRLVTWVSRKASLTLSSESEMFILLGCLLGAWITYRLFFRQIWEKEGDEWIQK
ncbi:hypothetical protein BH09BAC4_BH09BAC4_46050 [soil metagenome]